MAGTGQALDLNQFAQWAARTGADLSRLDFTPAFKRAAVALASSAKQNFAGQHAPDGSPWAPLQHPRARGGDQVLRDRGILMASLGGSHAEAPGIGGGRGSIESINANVLVWGTNLEYAAVHQFGHTFQRPEQTRDKPWVFLGPDGSLIFTRRIRAHTQTVPARPFIGVNDAVTEVINNIFREFLEQLLRVT